MFSTFVTVALFAAAALQGVLADFAINTPQLKQCQSSKISWAPTKGPYNLIVVKASDPCGVALVEIGDFKTETLTNWKAAIPAGTEVILSLIDSQDNEAWSNKITVGASDDTSCLKALAVTPPASTSSTASGSSSTSSSDLTPVGAANAQTNPFKNSAVNVRQASTPLLAVAGLVAAFALL